MTKPKKISLKVIAKLADCSTTTVSNVLNKKGLFGDDIRDKILKIVKDHGYTINPSARSLRMGKSETVAVVFYRPNVDVFKSEYYLTMMYGLQKRLAELGFEILLSEVTPGDVANNASPRFVSRGKADAIVVLGRVPENIVAELVRCGLPMLMLDSFFKNIDSIYTDGEKATAAMVERLVKSGRKTLAYFAYDNFDFNTDMRIKGFFSGAKKCGVENGALVIRNFTSNDGATAEFDKTFNSAKLPSAVLASNDDLATSLMCRAQERGLRVPRDIAFCGYDDTVLATRCTPQLTTAHVDCVKIGAIGAETIVERINNPDAPAKVKIFPAEIVERGSSK